MLMVINMAIGDICKIKDCQNKVTCEGRICQSHRHKKVYYGTYFPMLKTKPTREEYFNSKLTQKNSNNCILWTGRKDRVGYGVLWDGKKNIKAHRFSWELVNGEIPKGVYCLHKCDIRNCVNVDHLFLGTQQDNIEDMIAKKRNVLGWIKLRPHEVVEIKRLIRQNFHDVDIAKKFNVHRDTIRSIRNGKNWSHINE
jgi:hypothetical protein